ncbi:hypothetical protein Avbf_04405 [Armadillidium vulgare]|nr:hypothetical protein Avbf_04405 [Armadillidium vulgare]
MAAGRRKVKGGYPLNPSPVSFFGFTPVGESYCY